jgi:hypothetical protein
MWIVLAALAAPLSAATPTLEPFAPFAGSCWVADFTPTMRDTHCFEAMYGGAHVRDRHEVRDAGNIVYAGETIFSLDAGSIVFTYVNSLGGIGRGSITSDGLLHFKGGMRPSPDKPKQPIDSEWRLIDADHYEVRSLVPSKNGQLEQPLTFTRVPKKATN